MENILLCGRYTITGLSGTSSPGSSPVYSLPLTPVIVQPDKNDEIAPGPIKQPNILEGIVSSDILSMFGNIRPGSEAARFIDSLKSMTDNERTETMNRLGTAGSETELIIDALNDSSDEVSRRVGFVTASLGGGRFASSFLMTSVEDTSAAGVSAGDEGEHYGIWASPFYSRNVQKKQGAALNGHRADSAGIIIGFDTTATETTVVGAAATLINTKVKHKDTKNGDNTLIDSKVFTFYGIGQITNNFQLHGMANIASSEVINRNIRGAGNKKQVAIGQYATKTYSGEINGEYNFILGKSALIPVAGISYTYFKGDNYTEYGATNQNLTIVTKSTYKIGGVLGIKAAFTPYKLGDWQINPDIHTYVRRDLKSKSPKTCATLDGSNGNLAKETNKVTRTFTNIGLNLNAMYKTSEWGISYDATLSNKYIGHQVALKTRLEF